MKRSLTLTLVAATSALLLSHPYAAQAAVYKHIGDDGTVFFSDKPMKPGDKPYQSSGEVNKFDAPKDSKSAPQSPRQRYSGSVGDDDVGSPRKSREQAQAYQSISITTPADGSAVRSNDGDVNVQVTLNPPLQTKFKHKLVVTMDGSDTQQSSGASVSFKNVDRGTHQFSARVEDESGKVLLQSSPISASILRHSAIRTGSAH